jgi:hypothetical protein
MKKSVFLGISVMSLLGWRITDGQISRGDWLIGTAIGTGTITSSSDASAYLGPSTSYAGSSQTTAGTAYSLSLNPQVGYFVAGNLALGGILSFSLTSSHSSLTTSASSGIPLTITNSSAYTFTAGPFLRYYFGDPVLSSTLFFIQGDARLGTGDGTSSGNGNQNKYRYTSSGQTSGGLYWNAATEIGLVHFISKSVGLIAYAGYTFSSEKGSELNTTDYSYKGGATGPADAVDDHKFSNTSGSVTLSVGFNIYLASKKRK